jgi:hypothetical protein
VGAAQQLPLGSTGSQPSAHEPPTTLDGLDLAEDRLDGAAALGIAGPAFGAVEPGPHRRPQDVALGLRRLAVFAWRPWRPWRAGGINNSGASGIADTFAIDQ